MQQAFRSEAEFRPSLITARIEPLLFPRQLFEFFIEI